jgi:hypothetical protein
MTGVSWDRRPRQLPTPALRRQVSRSMKRSRTRRSVAISFCGLPLLTLLVSPVLPTDASHAYLQLWMGTHPTLPSKLLQGGGETLGERLKKTPELLGTRGLDDLPFLFKVLAIRKALSIQSHPDKKFAERLHAVAPNLYKGALPPFRIITRFLFLLSLPPTINRPESQTRNGHRVDTVPGHVRLQRAE